MEWNNNDLLEEKEEYAVEIRGLTVRYRIPSEKIDGVKEYLDKVIAHKLEHKEFVALKNVDLTIRKGERIGIIGHNGAGKSTLLKIIAHVIKPSEGTITVKGSIAPLLELGAGFDLELSGIENIYLNGSILGRSKRYLDSVKEDIIEFAELGEFINYSVKNYSSGMRAKLGFAVATQVDSDILLVDEVFGVGDENFKRKSKEKMVQMINSGKTVIIVSHDMTQIVDLTDRVIWMHNGEIIEEGDPQEICDKYCDYMLEHQNVVIEHRKAKPVKKEVSQKRRRKAAASQEQENKNTISKWAQRAGVLDKILNDPSAVDKLVYDRRIQKRIQNDDSIIENIVSLPRGLELVADNDELLYELLQSEAVKKKIAENPYLIMNPEKPVYNIWGTVNDCIYYEKEKVLYIKGWYMTVDAYHQVVITAEDKPLGEARCKLIRKNVNKGFDSLNNFAGWEFIARTDEIIKAVTIQAVQEEVVYTDEKEVLVSSERCPDGILKRMDWNYTENELMDLYQKFYIDLFNLNSPIKAREYYNLIVENDGGYLYQKDTLVSEVEFGFEFKTNSLGLRGPADCDADNVLFGNVLGLGLGVNEKDAWYSDEYFSENWLNISLVGGPSQAEYILENCMTKKARRKNAVFVYEDMIWVLGKIYEGWLSSGESLFDYMKWEKDLCHCLKKELENFYSFYNKLYSGTIGFLDFEEKKYLLDYHMGEFDFEREKLIFNQILKMWDNIFKKFEKVLVVRVPYKERAAFKVSNDRNIKKLVRNQELGWYKFKEFMSERNHIVFREMNDFELYDYEEGPLYWNEKGNKKFGENIKKELKIL